MSIKQIIQVRTLIEEFSPDNSLYDILRLYIIFDLCILFICIFAMLLGMLIEQNKSKLRSIMVSLKQLSVVAKFLTVFCS